MKLTLDPPSGHSDSYLDVSFKVETDMSDKIEIQFFNITTNEPLEILSVTQGYIFEEYTVITKNTNVVEGFINIFNKDKMNEKLKDYIRVEIKCFIKIYKENTVIEEVSTIFFYNESQSLDANIIPFDLIIDNPNLDLENNVPLKMCIISDNDKKYELAIRSSDSRSMCTFDVFAKKGKNDIYLPSEIIWYDLQIVHNYNKKFQIYWAKFEGVNHMRFMNRKYVLIENTDITFNARTMKPKPQTRLGPTGVDLSQDFILSHRYFVHTWKDYSAFGEQKSSRDIRSERAKLIYSVETMDISKKKDTSKEVNILNLPPAQELADPRQRLILNAYRQAYSQKKVITRSDQSFYKSSAVKTQSLKKKKGCGGCSRKKNA